jgi:hypothetical protein
MRNLFRMICSALAALAVTATLGYAQYVSSNYMAQGGADWEVGGTLNIKSGGILSFNSVDQTAALATAPAAVAAGYKVARGETALDGSNPTPVTTGLTTVTGCALTIKTTSAPGVSTSVLTYGSSSGTMNMYGWKVTGTGDATLIASTGTDTIGWVCLGT